jgi:hypothetical protein
MTMTMKTNVKKFLSLLTIITVLTLGTISAEAAFNTDLVGQSAIKSFSAMLEVLPFQPVADDAMGVWILTAPDGGAAFWWRKEENHMRAYDAFLCFDAEPFVNAGLDVSKLPNDMKEMLNDRGRLMVGTKLSKEQLKYEGEVTPLASFEQIVKLDRDRVGYHAALDHYGVTVSEGSMFEWAKDLDKNDKDIVFVLNPQVFLDAGVDPTKVEGWVFAKVPVEDARGRKIEADKFLKPFNLK